MSNYEVLSPEATNELTPTRRFNYALIDNVILLIVAPVLAACYLTYEYILAHYACVVLGSLFSCRVTCSVHLPRLAGGVYRVAGNVERVAHRRNSTYQRRATAVAGWG